MAPAAIPTANPIMKPIFTRSKQLGWVWPYGPTATGIWREETQTEDWLEIKQISSVAALKLSKLEVVNQTTS